MATYRVHKTKDYTVMSNVHFREKGMSLKAKGLLSLMLSLPEEWDYSINGLCAICVENETSIKSALKELKLFGYLVVNKKMPNETSSGRIEYEYNIYENPQSSEKQGIEKQGVENQPLEIQPLENQGQYNTNKLSTKELNIYKSSTKEKSVNYSAIVNAYNTLCISFPAVRNLSEARKKTIKARINAGYTQEDFITLFKTAQQSDFLKGKNDRNWKADFDWLIKDANMAKVLDGKYNNKTELKKEEYNYSYGQEGVDYL